MVPLCHILGWKKCWTDLTFLNPQPAVYCHGTFTSYIQTDNTKKTPVYLNSLLLKHLNQYHNIQPTELPKPVRAEITLFWHWAQEGIRGILSALSLETIPLTLYPCSSTTNNKRGHEKVNSHKEPCPHGHSFLLSFHSGQYFTITKYNPQPSIN